MLRSIEIECVAARVFVHRRCMIHRFFIELRVRKFIIDLIFGCTNTLKEKETKKLNMAMQHWAHQILYSNKKKKKNCTRLGISIECYIQMHLGHTYPSHTHSVNQSFVGSFYLLTYKFNTHKRIVSFFVLNVSFIQWSPPISQNYILRWRAHTECADFSPKRCCCCCCMFTFFSSHSCETENVMIWMSMCVCVYVCASVFDLTQFYLRNPIWYVCMREVS